MNSLKNILKLCYICILGISCISCSKNTQNPTPMNEVSNASTEMPLPTLESKAEIEEPESKLVISKKAFTSSIFTGWMKASDF